jgi:hypothetical protein
VSIENYAWEIGQIHAEKESVAMLVDSNKIKDIEPRSSFSLGGLEYDLEQVYRSYRR